MYIFLQDFSRKYGSEVEFIDIETDRTLFDALQLKVTPTVFVRNTQVNLQQLTSYDELERQLLELTSGNSSAKSA